MKTTNLFTIALAIITIFSSCKKDNPVKPLGPEPKKCLLANEFDGKFFNAYFYSTDHSKISQTKYKSDNYPDTSVTDYIYTGNVIALKNLSGAVFNRYYINSNGYIDSSVSNNQGYYMKYTYSYYPDGYLSQSINQGYFGTFEFFSDSRYFYQNGNLVRSVSYQESGDSVEFTYDYFTDQKNHFGKSIEIQQMTGKQSKNLLKSITRNIGFSYKYTYQYNADQLPFKKIQVNANNDTITTLYNWTCY
ncbi:MAG: hypothetical protein Q8M15_00295 [Bacteroidota bacterium]|nr:hypothetical protein [Bacteroidota bacterium]